MSATPIKDLQVKAQQLRTMMFDMCCKAGTGHITSSYSCVEILTALYYGRIMQFDPANPDWECRDRFIMSKGQASPLLYTVLADLGYFPKGDMASFCAAEGKFGVHLQHSVPGAEITAGSLGMGFGIAAGIALAAKLNRQLHMTYALLGDGECYEGSVWEAAMFASHNRLNNLVAIVDRNFLCATNFTENMLSLEPFADKWSSFGWRAVEIDGHDFKAILDALDGVRSRQFAQPTVIIAKTVKGHGIPSMCFDPLWHAVTPTGEKAVCCKNELEEGACYYD
jgi:transketolase